MNYAVLPIALSNSSKKCYFLTTYEYDMSQPLKEKFESIDTITWTDFKNQYGTFEILVADCEGALFEIIQEINDF